MLIILDDTIEISEIVRDIIGTKGFSQVVVKRKKLENYFQEALQRLYPDAQIRTIHSQFELAELLDGIRNGRIQEGKVLHCYSNFILADEESALLTYAKLKYIDSDYRVTSEGKTAAYMFHQTESYCSFLEGTCEVQDIIPISGLVDIGVVGNFIQCITGNFDSRYFNSLQGDEYTIVKKSSDKDKIRKEYRYYHLLPEDMQHWFVLPYHYTENEEFASYAMERLHMTDLAIKWVHGSIDMSEFERILDKYFYFFGARHKEQISESEYQASAKNLYEDKVLERVNTLKQMPEYSKIEELMKAGCKDKGIDELVSRYLELKAKIEGKNTYEPTRVIGHGDPCFSNALYNNATRTLKFIDPKGADSEEELWMNPYYDIAKLSHSICGRYDFFNNGLFDIKVNEQFEHELIIDFDNTKYVEAFRKKLEQCGYDYQTVRIYETSLFISMLPLHMDNPYKVFGFILNAEQILDELEKEV